MACQMIAESSKILGVQLKEMQMQAVLSSVEGKGAFVSLPAGCRKSLIDGILPHVFDKMRG